MYGEVKVDDKILTQNFMLFIIHIFQNIQPFS